MALPFAPIREVEMLRLSWLQHDPQVLVETDPRPKPPTPSLIYPPYPECWKMDPSVRKPQKVQKSKSSIFRLKTKVAHSAWHLETPTDAGASLPLLRYPAPDNLPSMNFRAMAEANALRTKQLDELADREPEARRDVEKLILSKTSKGYDKAVAILRDLRDMAARSDRGDEFSSQVNVLRANHSSKSSFIRRLQNAGL